MPTPEKYRLTMRLNELEPDCTLDDVARELGVTRERVRQIEARALHKLRKALAKLGYRARDFFDDAKKEPRP